MSQILCALDCGAKCIYFLVGGPYQKLASPCYREYLANIKCECVAVLEALIERSSRC